MLANANIAFSKESIPNVMYKENNFNITTQHNNFNSQTLYEQST